MPALPADRVARYRLSPVQRTILSLAILAIVAMGFYPPWTSTYYPTQGTPIKTFAGYHAIYSPPPRRGPTGIRINYERLLVQWTGAIIVTGGLLWLFQPARPAPRR
jgi:hypothetical protein